MERKILPVEFDLKKLVKRVINGKKKYDYVDLCYYAEVNKLGIEIIDV